MAIETANYSFSDLLSNIVDNRGKTCPVAEDGLPLIATNCVKNETLFPMFEKVRYVDKETYDNWFRGHPEPGDMIFVTKGSPGNVCWTPDPVNFCIAQDMVAIRANPEIVDSKYLFALLRSRRTQHSILNMHVGTLIPHFKKGDFKNLYFDIPRDLGLQRSIGETYFAFCEKIELNRQMNFTLEGMAQALFKSWFVDFDPVIDNALAADNPIPDSLKALAESRKAQGEQRKPLPEAIQNRFPNRFVFNDDLGWVPEGWDPVPLGEYVTVKRGGSPRPIHDYLVDDGLPCVKISDATASDSRFLMGTKQFIKPEGLSKTVKLKKGELILSNSATPGIPKFLNLDACIHDGWLYFPKKKLFTDNYLYQLFLVIRDALLSQGNGSVFTNLKTDILKNHCVVVPNKLLLEAAESRFDEIKQRCLLIQEQTESLTKTRDTLLPKLLSGQLRIPEAEQQVAEAL